MPSSEQNPEECDPACYTQGHSAGQAATKMIVVLQLGTKSFYTASTSATTVTLRKLLL